MRGLVLDHQQMGTLCKHEPHNDAKYSVIVKLQYSLIDAPAGFRFPSWGLLNDVHASSSISDVDKDYVND